MKNGKLALFALLTSATILHPSMDGYAMMSLEEESCSLSSPPKFEDFRQISDGTKASSYFFNGPENTTREGGPVPVGYGELLVGSQVISASYEIGSQLTSQGLTS